MPSYYIIIIGCQMNYSDSERLASYLESQGLVLAANEFAADVVILTTCGIRQSAEDRVYGLVNRIKKKNPKSVMIITGCLSERPDVKKRLPGKVDIWLPITAMPQLMDRIKEVRPQIMAKEEKELKDYFGVPPKHQSSFSAYVPIGNGCNNFCSYCVVPYARGREKYRSAREIIKEVKGLVQSGYKEIILIAQNVNSFRSGASDFADLLEKINDIPGDFWIRFASSHPKDISLKLIKAIGRLFKVCEHVHFAVQSGDDQILKAMNRRYSAKHYQDLVKKIRESGRKYKRELPLAITTDVIVGFPGETEAQFKNTVKLFKTIKFDMAYISQYSPRYGTVSYQMKDDVTRLEKKRREKILDQVLQQTALANNKYYKNKVVAVLVEGKNRQGEWYGKTRSYKTVQISGATGGDLVGCFALVKIDKVRDFALSGKIVAQYE